MRELRRGWACSVGAVRVWRRASGGGDVVIADVVVVVRGAGEGL
jgi:hypothetical protein